MNEAEIKLDLFRMLDSLQGEALRQAYEQLLTWHSEQNRATFLQNLRRFLQAASPEVQEKCLREWAQAVPAENADLDWKIGFGFSAEKQEFQLNLSVKVCSAIALPGSEKMNFSALLDRFFAASSPEILQKINAKLEELLTHSDFEFNCLPTLYLEPGTAVNHLILRAKPGNITQNSVL